jgi:hypothetical protein
MVDWPKKETTWVNQRVLYVSIPFTWNLPSVKLNLQQKSLFWDRAVIGRISHCYLWRQVMKFKDINPGDKVWLEPFFSYYDGGWTAVRSSIVVELTKNGRIYLEGYERTVTAGDCYPTEKESLLAFRDDLSKQLYLISVAIGKIELSENR